MTYADQDTHQGEGRLARFLFVFCLIFLLSLSFLSLMGAVPTPAAGEVRVETAIEEPLRIVAETINLDEEIENPESSDMEVLDAALSRGAVRYPGSARLGEKGNLLLFGHSSYLSVVNNSAYRTFNDIQKLHADDIVRVYSGTREHRYRVTSVRFAKAEEETIGLGGEGQRLTLVTCNSFKTASDRFIVEAEFVGSYPLAS